MATVLPEERLTDLRKRILAGEDPSDEEIANILTTLRAKRGHSIAVGGTKKAAAAPIDLKELFKKD